MNVRRTLGRMALIGAVMGLLASAIPKVQAQSINSYNETCTEGFLGDYWDTTWSVTWSAPYNLTGVGMFTYAKGLAKFKMSNGTFQNANDVTIKSFSSGLYSSTANFTDTRNIPLLFLPQMPNGAVELWWKVDWRATLSWNGGFVTDSYTEPNWRIHTY